MRPDVPVPQWHLSDVGRQRAEVFARNTILSDTRRIIASDEHKAQETAAIISAALNVLVETQTDLGENDRSSTGFLEREAFERAADAFFGVPDVSYRGWETSRAAQTRIVEAVLADLDPVAGDVLHVGHGAVGTLLFCHLAGFDISREHDQPDGGGNVFAFDIATRELLHGWVPVEAV